MTPSRHNNLTNNSFSFTMVVLTLIYTVLMIMSNITSNKLVIIYDYVFDAGFLFFPLTYVINDICTEIYGFKISRRIIWTGLLMNIFSSIMLMIAIAMPALDERAHFFDLAMNSSYRIFIASIISYIIGEFLNSMIMSQTKIIARGKYYYLRSVMSTTIGVIIESTLFFIIAFYGIVENEILWQMFIIQVILKIAVAIFCAPLSGILVKKIKVIEQMDIYDYHQKYSIFKF